MHLWVMEKWDLHPARVVLPGLQWAVYMQAALIPSDAGRVAGKWGAEAISSPAAGSCYSSPFVEHSSLDISFRLLKDSFESTAVK